MKRTKNLLLPTTPFAKLAHNSSLSVNKVSSNKVLSDFRWQILGQMSTKGIPKSLPFIFSVVLRTGATSEIKFAEVTGGGGGAKS